MAAERGVQEALDGLAAILPAELTTQLDTIEAATSLALPDPIRYLVTQDDIDEQSLGVVYIQTDGPVAHRDWLTPQTDIAIPLLIVMIEHAGGASSVTADKIGRYYARAIVNALNSIGDAVAGVWLLTIGSSDVVQFGEDRHRRRIDVRATMHLRTERITG